MTFRSFGANELFFHPIKYVLQKCARAKKTPRFGLVKVRFSLNPFLFSSLFLFQDHVQEVLNKWESIDDEIWAKIIVLERNRRVAKAYARAPVLTVNGSDDGFDGFRIGLAGFENPMRDPKTEEVKKHIGQVRV